MADQVLTKQKLINADEDVQALEDVVNGEPGKLIKTRLGREVYTLASVPQINTMTREEVTAAVASRAPQGTTYTKTEVDSALSLKAPQSNTYTKGEVDASLTAIAGGHKAYGSMAAALANTSTFPQNSIIEITNDPDASKNGTYQWNGGDLTKSAYDPLTQAKNHIDSKVGGTVGLGQNLNTLDAGLYHIPSNVLQAGLLDPSLNYPPVIFSSGLIASIEVIRNSAFTNQVFNIAIRGEQYSRSGRADLTPSAWVRNFKNTALTASDDLNTLTVPGVYTYPSAVLTSALNDGTKNYPQRMQRGAGGIVIVGVSGSYTYQTIISSGQKQIWTRFIGQTWVDYFTSNKNTVVSCGSSTLANMTVPLRTTFNDMGLSFLNQAESGIVVQAASAKQRSNTVRLSFPNGIIPTSGTAVDVNVEMDWLVDNKAMSANYAIELSNGIKGGCNFTTKKFTPDNVTTPLTVPSDIKFEVEFTGSIYDMALNDEAIHIFSIGKNNISSNYSALDTFNGQNKMVEFILKRRNFRFIVLGFFVNRGATSLQKTNTLLANELMEQQYGTRFIDMQNYLMSSQIWSDLSITPTQDDLDKQALGELPVSLSRDSGHTSAEVDALFVNKIKQKIIDLGY